MGRPSPYSPQLVAPPYLPKPFRFEGQEEVLISRDRERVILEPTRRRWSRAFIELAGSAPDFPYPEEPHTAEPGPGQQDQR